MTFKALACDYDGTLASHDRIGEEALAALARALAAGLRLVLVTGRTFFELIRVCEPLDLFAHAIVRRVELQGAADLQERRVFLAQPMLVDLSDLTQRGNLFIVGDEVRQIAI